MKNTPGEKLYTPVIISAAYIALTMFSNLGSLRIILFLGFSMDAGTLLYPFTFTARDVLHKRTGAANTRMVIWLSAAVNLLMFGFVWLVSALPPDMTVGAQSEYGKVLLPGIRLVIGSIIAMLISELIDTVVYSLVKARFGEKKQWLRVVVSNLISVPVDTTVFLLIAFYGIYPFSVLENIFISNIILKFAVSLASLWTIYLVKEVKE